MEVWFVSSQRRKQGNFITWWHLFLLSGNFHMKTTHTLSILANSLGRTYLRPERVRKGKISTKSGILHCGTRKLWIQSLKPFSWGKNHQVQEARKSASSLPFNQSHLHSVNYNQKKSGKHTIQEKLNSLKMQWEPRQ